MESQRTDELSICYQPIPALVAYERNARTHSKPQIRQIAESIQTFGFTNPILIDKDNIIVAGHGRLAAAKLIGMAEVPTIRLENLTPDQLRAYVIADNRLAENAGWDESILSIELQHLINVDDLGFDITLTGFEISDIDRLLHLTPAEEEEPVVEVDETRPAVTQPGDLYILGNHRLMCGDSTQFVNIERLMDGARADCIWTDPPYNVNYQGRTKDQLRIENDSMDDGAFRRFLCDAFKGMLVVAREGAAIYVAHADLEGYNFRGAFVDAGWSLRQCLVWAKQTLVLGRSDYQWQHEPILYGSKPGAPHRWWSDRKQTTLLEFDRPSRNGEHPTMKPVDLVEYCIRNNTIRGERVLDVFGGSGTTLVACEKSGRKAYLIELDPKYCDVIVKRWQIHTGDEAVNAVTGKSFHDMTAAAEVAHG